MVIYFFKLIIWRQCCCCCCWCCCCCCLAAKSWLTLCDPMDCNTPGFSVPHHLQEFAQVHVHWISDAIQPSHTLSPSSTSAFNFFPSRVIPKRSRITSGFSPVMVEVKIQWIYDSGKIISNLQICTYPEINFLRVGVKTFWNMQIHSKCISLLYQQLTG